MDNLAQTPQASQSQPTQLQPPTPPPMPEPPQARNLFKWILVVTAVAILSSTATYFVVQSQQQISLPQVVQTPPSPALTPILQPSTDETANWKTYVSEDKTFSFKYPPEWIYGIGKTIREFQNKEYSGISLVFVSNILDNYITKEQREAGFLDLNDLVPETYSLNFSLFYATSPDFKRLSLDDLVEALMRPRAQVDEQKNILLGGNIRAKEVGYGCQAYCIDIIFKKNNTVFDSSTGPNADLNIRTLRQILSTFKFTQ